MDFPWCQVSDKASRFGKDIKGHRMDVRIDTEVSSRPALAARHLATHNSASSSLETWGGRVGHLSFW